MAKATRPANRSRRSSGMANSSKSRRSQVKEAGAKLRSLVAAKGSSQKMTSHH